MAELTRFQDWLDAYGADLGRWPARERARAEALLAQSDAARAALRTAERFEHLLADAVPDVPRERLRRNILAALPAPGLADGPGAVGSGRGAGMLRWLWAGGVGAAAASMALSFYLGTANPTVWPDQTTTATADETVDLTDDFDSMLLGIGFGGDVT